MPRASIWIGSCVLVLIASCGGGGDGGDGATPGDACVPACAGRDCGDDQCGGSCGSCTDQICDLAGRCVPDCGADSHPEGDACVCDAGFTLASDCAGCEPDLDQDGCREDALMATGGCECVGGFSPAADACAGCQPDGNLGSPCTADTDCALGAFDVCALSLADFRNTFGTSSLTAALPDGYCSLQTCLGDFGAPCTAAGGICVHVQFTDFSDMVHYCLLTCGSNADCREGQVCRDLTEADGFQANPSVVQACLPAL